MKSKEIFSLCLISMMVLPLSMLAQPQALSHPFNQITSVTPLDNNILLVTQQKGDYKAKIYNISKDSVVHRFIPKGSGPGESNAIKAAHFSENKEWFTFYSQDNRWIQTDLNGELIRESKSSIGGIGHICNTAESKMDVFLSTHLPSSMVEDNLPFPVAYSVDLESLKNIDSVYVTPGQLALNEIDGVGKTHTVKLDIMGHRIDAHRLLLTYQGSENLFLFEEGEMIKRIPVTIQDNFGMKVSTRNGRTGIQIAAVFTYLQHLENGLLLFSMGNTHQDLPMGAIYVSVSNDNQVHISHEILYNDIEGESGGFNQIFTGDKRIWFSDFYFTAYSLYLETLTP